MTTRNLDAVFRPQSVALIGASDRPHSVGYVIAENLRESGFEGPILPVNPRHRSVAGILCYPDVKSLPVVPDLAIICTPTQTIPNLIAELGERGTRAAIVVTAGFREGGNEAGAALQSQMLTAAKPHLLRVIGPNCLGVISTPAKLNASFAPSTPKAGGVAFIAQSGAIVTTVTDWASGRGIGFSHLISLGDMSDVDFGDTLDYLATDPDTTSILLYIEAVTNARKFMSAARAASKLKPVIAIKAGRQAAAARAATSHTGALAGMDAVYDAAFDRAGVLRAFDLDEIFDAVETLAKRPKIAGNKLVIVTNGGGVGVLATDALIAQGGELATLSDNTMTRLNEVLPPTWSHGNPIDIIGDADAARYDAVLQVLAPCAEADAVLVLNCPVAVASSIDAAKVVIAERRTLNKPLLANWLGARAVEESRPLFEDAGIPNYETPEKAVRGFMHLARYHSLQATLQEVPAAVPDSFHPDRTKARKIIEASLRTETKWLDPQAITELFATYDIPIARTAIVKTPEEAARMADTISAPVALKIFSRDLTHKSDVGGVMLDLNGADAVSAAAEAMLARVAKAAPNARLDGFIVQEMIRRPYAYELIVGMAQDVTFGPFLLFGHGGTAVEVIDDKALGLPPLNMKLAREMMQRTRIWRQLKGYRDRAAVATDAIASTLVKISQLISDFAEIVELDINPLLADEAGVIAVDARIRMAMPAPTSAETRMAIRPYPQELEEHVEIPQAGAFFMRPVRPEDAEAFVRLAGRVSPSDLHMRFFSLFRNIPLPLLVRLTQIDYDREMAFVLFDKDKDVAGVGRLVAEPDGTRAEFAVLVRTDLKAHGIGWALMTKLINYARHRGIAELFGEILVENEAMLGLAHSLGFKIYPSSQGVARATLTL